jgi:hypothetical protein
MCPPEGDKELSYIIKLPAGTTIEAHRDYLKREGVTDFDPTTVELKKQGYQKADLERLRAKGISENVIESFASIRPWYVAPELSPGTLEVIRRGPGVSVERNEEFEFDEMDLVDSA